MKPSCYYESYGEYGRAIYDFWHQFDGSIGRRSRKGLQHSLSPEIKLDMLKRMADLVVIPKRRKTLTEMREQFEVKKHEVKGLRLVTARGFTKSCFVCNHAADVRHHIIQLQNGGQNRRRNVVPLCRSCHAEVHPWLKVA